MSELRFMTTEDFLASNPGNTYLVDKPTSVLLADSTSDLGTFVYRLRLIEADPDENLGHVVLEKLDSTLSPVGDPKILFFSRSGAKIDSSDPDSFRFIYPSNHILILEATISTDIRSQTGSMTPSQRSVETNLRLSKMKKTPWKFTRCAVSNFQNVIDSY